MRHAREEHRVHAAGYATRDTSRKAAKRHGVVRVCLPTRFQTRISCLTCRAAQNAIVLDADGFFDWIVMNMKRTILAALVGIVMVATGCVSTVTDTHTAAMVPFGRDSVEGRYQRTVDQVYQASVQVIQHNGVVITEYIPHDTTTPCGHCWAR